MDAFDLLRTLTAAFAADTRRVPMQAGPAALGRWTAADLVAHLGGVHRWAAANARGTVRNHRHNVPAISVPPAVYYAESREILLDTLAGLDPDQRCYTFASYDKTVRFWHRRQAHETFVHLWDLRSATDPGAPAPAEAGPDACADGVDELFGLFVARAGPKARLPLPGSLGLTATDVDRRWVVRQGEDWTVHRDATEPADAEVRGAAGDLLLLVWNRVGPEQDRFAVTGDPGPIETFLRAGVRP